MHESQRRLGHRPSCNRVQISRSGDWARDGSGVAPDQVRLHQGQIGRSHRAQEARFMVSPGCRRTLPLMAALFVALSGCAGSPSQESTGEYVDDSVITAKVKAALAADPGVRDPTALNVETFRGVVYLTGFADFRQEADQAV